MCVKFSPSIYRNSRLDTNRGLALSLSNICDSRLMGSETLHYRQGNSFRYPHLQLIEGTVRCLFSLRSDHVLCVPVSPLYLCSILPLFGKSSVEEKWDMAAGWTLVAFLFFSSSLPPIRSAGSGPDIAVFVVVLGEANLTLPTLLRRFEVLNALIIVAGCSLLWLLFQSSALL